MGKINELEKEKSIYRQAREKEELTREAASELIKVMTVDRIERIENERAHPNPYEVVKMAEYYKAHHLCNYYCTHECEIGQQYVPEIKIKDLSQIVLATLASLNSIDEKKNRFIEIAADGKITGEELKDFILIKRELEQISMAVDSLKLWTEQMKSSGLIDDDEYKKEMEVLKA